MMMDWLRKWLSMSHPVSGKSASAVPHVLGSGDPPVMSDGMLPRANCHILMPALRHSSAMTPPPPALNSSPYVAVDPSTPQPVLLVPLDAQLACVEEPVILRLWFMLQPDDVWSVMALPSSARFVASITSISPLSGQLDGSASHSAGHVPQP